VKKELMQWPFFYHVGHYYNNSPQLPVFLQYLKIFLILMQTLPLYWSLPRIRDLDHISIFASIKDFSNFIIYCEIVPLRSLQKVLFAIMTIIVIICFIVMNIKKGLIFKSFPSLLLRFSLEFLTPIMFFWSCTSLQKCIYYYIRDEILIVNLIISVLNVTGYLVLLLFLTIFQSRTIYISNDPFFSWNSWNFFFYLLIPLFIQQFWDISNSNVGDNRIIIFTITTLFSLIYLIYNMRIIFFNHISAFFMLYLFSVSFILNANQLVFSVWPHLYSDMFFYLQLVMLFFSVFFAGWATNWGARMPLSLSNILSISDEDKETELDDLDQQFSGAQIDVDNTRSIYFLRNMCLKNLVRASKVAAFLAARSSNVDIQIEAFRVLMMTQSVTANHCISILSLQRNEVPFSTIQLVCDLQYEALTISGKEEDLNPFLDILNEKVSSIRRILLVLIDKISCNSPKHFSDIVYAYSRNCFDYENLVSQIILQSPNSTKISYKVGQYYRHYRGHSELSHIWKSRFDANRSHANLFTSSVGNQGIGMRTSRQGGSISTMSDIYSPNKSNAHEALKRLKSSSSFWSIFWISIFFLFCLFLVLYIFDPSFVSYISNEETFFINLRIARLVFAPTTYSYLFSNSIIDKCNLSSSSIMDSFNNSYFSPFNPSQDSVIKIIELLSRNISILQESLTTENSNLYPMWSQLTVNEKYNITLNFLLVHIAILSDSFPSASCDSNSLSYLLEYTDHYLSSLPSMVGLQNSIRDLTIEQSALHESKFLIISHIMIIIIIVLMIIIYFYSYHRRRVERSYFWNVFLDIDDKSIEESRFDMQNNHSTHFSQIRNPSNDEAILFGANDLDENLINDSKILFPTPSPSIGVLDKYSQWHPRNMSSFMLYSLLFVVLFSFFRFFMNFPSQTVTNAVIELERIATSICIASGKLAVITEECALLAINQSLYFNTSSVHAENIYQILNNVSEMIKPSQYLTTSFESYFFNILGNLTELGTLFSLFNQSVYSFIQGNYAINNDFYSILNLSFKNITKLSYYVYEDFHNGYQGLFSSHYDLYLYINHCLAVFLIIFVIISFVREIAYMQEFESLKSILLLLSTSYHTTVSNILSNFDQSSNKDRDNTINQSRYIIKQSNNPILIIDSSCYIQDANKAAIDFLSYRKDLLIQMEIDQVFESSGPSYPGNQSYSDFKTQLMQGVESLKRNDIKYNLNVRVNGQKIVPVSCFLIKVGNDDKSESTAPKYAIVLRDRTSFLAQEQKFHEAKSKVEKLLYSILPPVFAMKLLSGSSKLHSNKERGTIIFIGIANFIEWSAEHTHTEIMEFLDNIFTRFDEMMRDYKTLVRIKVIGGVYMAAGGLFNEVNDRDHEKEAVRFALDCSRWVMMNEQHLGIHLTIGINTGGPIISGILGNDKPLFDIWGDAVNTSSRLQTSCPIDCIQISPETMNKCGSENLHGEERIVYLKGKGERKAFLINIREYIHQ